MEKETPTGNPRRTGDVEWDCWNAHPSLLMPNLPRDAWAHIPYRCTTMRQQHSIRHHTCALCQRKSIEAVSVHMVQHKPMEASMNGLFEEIPHTGTWKINLCNKCVTFHKDELPKDLENTERCTCPFVAVAVKEIMPDQTQENDIGE